MGLVIGAMWSVVPAFAEHEANHRYTVSGYVRDVRGDPRVGVSVVAEHKGGEKKSTMTDQWGHYRIRFHLHDQNHRNEIVVKAGEEVKTLRMEFVADDHVTERQGQVDFGRPVKAGWMGTASKIIGVGLVVGGVYYWRNRQKTLKRHRRQEEKSSKRRR